MSKFTNVIVKHVVVDPLTNSVAVILADKQNTWLPIAIGLSEAYMINLYINGLQAPRPGVYELLSFIMRKNYMQPEKVVVEKLQNNIYHASLHLKKSALKNKLGSLFRSKKEVIDARPSDCIALALKYNVPILVNEEVMKTAGFPAEMHDTQQQDLQRALQQAVENQIPGVTTSSDEAAEERDIDTLTSLRLRLKKAVTDERYEDASQLRDEIAAIERMRQEKEEAQARELPDIEELPPPEDKDKDDMFGELAE